MAAPVSDPAILSGRCGRIEVDVDKASGSIVSFETEDQRFSQLVLRRVAGTVASR